LSDEPEPLGNARRHRRLDPFPVPLELVDHERGHDQLDLALMDEDTEGDDPPLPVAPLGHVKPRRRVTEKVQHASQHIGHRFHHFPAHAAPPADVSASRADGATIALRSRKASEFAVASDGRI
jgi:hypothetical protein